MEDQTPIRLLLQHQGEFMAYLMAITRDLDSAEEVFQNAAVVIIEGAASGATIRNFRAWAKEVVRRQALYYLRQQSLSARRVRPVAPELFEAISQTFVAEGGDTVGREVQALQECLEKVPPRQRRMLARRYEERASFGEIGQEIGSTDSAVQRALSRLRKALHDCVRATLARLEGAAE